MSTNRKITKTAKAKILSLDLSLNLPAACVAEVEGGLFTIIDIYHVDNKKLTKLTHAEKLQRIQEMLEVIAEQHHDITHVVRERGFSRYSQTTQTLFKVVGVSDLAGIRLFGKAEIEEIPPTTIKTVVAGYSRADKQEVEEGVRELLQEHQKDMKFYSDDESDAVAVGLTYCIKKGWLN